MNHSNIQNYEVSCHLFYAIYSKIRKYVATRLCSAFSCRTSFCRSEMSSNDTPLSSCSRLQGESIALTVLNADMPGWLTSRGCFLCQHGNIEAGRSRRCHIRQSQHHRRIINPAVYITTPLSSRRHSAAVSFFFFPFLFSFFFFFFRNRGHYAPTNDVMTLKMTLLVIRFHFDCSRPR